MKSDHDIYLFREGTHTKLYNKLGCHLQSNGGANFAVWAPNAESVSVVGDWNYWSGNVDHLGLRDDGSGIWQGFVENAVRGRASTPNGTRASSTTGAMKCAAS